MKLKKFCLMAMVIYIGAMVLLGNPFTKNPKKPTGANYGRQIPLKTISTIEDDGENFFFKWPSQIKIASNGNIFIVDQNQLIELSPQGAFIKNFWQHGQGAGEMSFLSDYFLLPNNELMAHNAYPNKILVFDGAGKCIQEKRLEPNKFMTCFFQNEDNYYLIREEVGATKKEAQEVIVDIQIIAISKKDNTYQKLLSFPLINFVIVSPDNAYQIRTTPFLIRHYKENLFWVCHTADYQIKLIDLNTNKVLMVFGRDYDRAKVTKKNEEFVPQGKVGWGNKLYKSPIPKYLNDIQSLHTVEGKLWVFTSTVTEKGVLVDVYDDQCKYIDCFYLNFQSDKANYRVEKTQLVILNNTLYHIEQNRDDDWVIKKYEMQPGLLP